MRTPQLGAWKMTVAEPLELHSRIQLHTLGCRALEHDRTSPSQARVSVLVVDDDERVRWVTARMLREEGYHVTEAPSAEQAWKRLAEDSEIQVVLTDIAMPGGNGVELAERIVAGLPLRHVVLMSGYDRLFPKLGEPGAQFPLLIKPFNAEQLLHQVRILLRGDH
jgi:two-component system, cell cycle sensor histidine kinase and response regulator CckA